MRLQCQIQFDCFCLLLIQGSNFNAFSAHARLGSNKFIILHFDQHPFPNLLLVNSSSFHHVVQSNVKPYNGLAFPHSSLPPATIASHFVHSLAEQHYAKEVHFCKSINLIQHAPKTHTHVSNSFHKTITHGESHGIFRSSFRSNGVSLHFTIELLPSVAYPIFPGPPYMYADLQFIRPSIYILTIKTKTVYQ